MFQKSYEFFSRVPYVLTDFGQNENYSATDLSFHQSIMYLTLISKTCDALYDLVQFVQFKKREKHPLRSASKVADFSL